jgi:hypothetical protein
MTIQFIVDGVNGRDERVIFGALANTLTNLKLAPVFIKRT